MNHSHTTAASQLSGRCTRALAAATALLALATPAASARTIDSGTEPIEDTIEINFCGYVISLNSVGTETWVDRLRGGDVDEFQYLTPWFTSVRGLVTDTFTNLETGRSFQNVVRSRNWDQRLLAVDGNLQTYRRSGTFHRTLFVEGERQYVSTGSYSYDYVYDTQGTPGPEDDTDAFVEGSYRQVGNGRDDFCQDVLDYTS